MRNPRLIGTRLQNRLHFDVFLAVANCELRLVGRMLDLIRCLRAGSLIWTIEDQRRIVNLNILKAKLKGGRVDDCGELL